MTHLMAHPELIPLLRLFGNFAEILGFGFLVVALSKGIRK
jgi:hypothetical protein